MRHLPYLLLLYSLNVCCQIPAYVPTLGLQGYWPFSANANDHWSNSYHGTVVGAALTSDRFNSSNSAYSFNGSSNYISTPYTGILGTNPRAVSFWAKTSSSAIMSGVSWGSNGTASRYECGFNYGAPGPMLDGGNGVITYSPVTPANNNNWHHYVMQFGSSSALNQVQIYQDGVLLTTTSNVYSGSNTLSTISYSTVVFGFIPFSPYHYFSGALDDIGIWNRPLTMCEIRQLYLSASLTASVSAGNSGCGSATVSASGLPGPYSYTWFPSGGNGSTAFGLSAGTYSYHVSAQQCLLTGTVYVSGSPLMMNASAVNSCAGSPVVLSANGATSYTWQPGNLSGQSVTVSPTASTTYSVSGNVNNCIAMSTLQLNIQPAPVFSLFSTNPAVCAGKSATLYAMGASGYTWQPGGHQSNFYPVSPPATTVYTVTAFGSNGCMGTSVISQTINPLPIVILTPFSAGLCNGTSTVLTASGASSYTWQPGNLTGPNLFVNAQVSTTFSVTGTDANGCRNTATSLLLVYPNPQISVSSLSNTSCAGKPVNLTASGASTYTWQSGNLIGPLITVTPNVTTAYVVSGHDVNGCFGTTTYTQNVVPNPVVSIAASQTLLCWESGGVQLTASGALAYTWQPGTMNAASVSVAPLITTIYTVVGTDANGCEGVQSIKITVSPCTGLPSGDVNKAMLEVYPNPSSGDFIVRINAEGILRIFNLAGRLILEKQLGMGQHEMKPELPGGIYIIVFETGKDNGTVVKTRLSIE